MTIKFQEAFTNDGTPLYDTPGLQENNKAKAIEAGRQITQGMALGGFFKIIFVIRCVGKKHALKKYEEFILNTSCFCTM